MRRLRGERGSASIELVGFLPLMFLIAMSVWQLHIAGSAANAVADAARTASRVQALGGDGCRAALRALPASQRASAEIRIDGNRCRPPRPLTGQRVEIRTDVPTVIPGLRTAIFHVDGRAELPGGS